jgi:hypothetical protein
MNDEILIEEFERKLQSEYRGQYIAIQSWMETLANLKLLPKTKFHPLDKGKKKTDTFEFKTKDLRIYGMSLTGGKIIILGGFKGIGQNQDIKRVKKIAKEIKKQNLNPNGERRITQES